ncbi:MAG: TadE/TadG family type IV pilus assembly protein [Gammaproteobacteria bacterium]
MKRNSKQRGIAAVELAILLPLLALLLTVPLLFGRYFHAYTVAQKAAQDAARYMATIPQAEMKSTALVDASVDAARAIVAAELADLHLGGSERVAVLCDAVCAGAGLLPATVRVQIRFAITDDILSAWFAGDNGYHINADVTMPYAGH